MLPVPLHSNAHTVGGAAVIMTGEKTYVILLPPTVTADMVEGFPADDSIGTAYYVPQVRMARDHQELYDVLRGLLGSHISTAN